jgi:hypothetical protein
MLSSVLNSQRAVQVNIQIVRIFVRLRRYLATHKELASKLNELESVVGEHDGAIRQIFEAIRQLITKPVPRKKRIGFSSLRTADSPL